MFLAAMTLFSLGTLICALSPGFALLFVVRPATVLLSLRQSRARPAGGGGAP